MTPRPGKRLTQQADGGARDDGRHRSSAGEPDDSARGRQGRQDICLRLEALSVSAKNGGIRRKRRNLTILGGADSWMIEMRVSEIHGRSGFETTVRIRTVQVVWFAKSATTRPQAPRRVGVWMTKRYLSRHPMDPFKANVPSSRSETYARYLQRQSFRLQTCQLARVRILMTGSDRSIANVNSTRLVLTACPVHALVSVSQHS